ncbi:MAG TPA: hypothetical protein VGG64_01585 [Pirellulales bacterium]
MASRPRPSRYDWVPPSAPTMIEPQQSRAPEEDASPGTIRLPGTSGADLVEQLGLLDDVVFEAIAGRAGALAKLQSLWPQVKSAVGPALVDESREQYVRHALRVWRRCLAGEELHDPAHALAALDVVSLLFDE